MPVPPRNDDEETKVLTITTPKAEEPESGRAPTMRELEQTHATLVSFQQPDTLHDEVKKLCCNGKHEENGHEATEERMAALKRRISGGSKLRLRKKKKRKN